MNLDECISCCIVAKDVWPQSYPEKTSHESTWWVIKHSWSVLFNTVKDINEKKKTKNKTTIGYTLLNKCETQVMANPRLDPQPEKEISMKCE